MAEAETSGSGLPDKKHTIIILQWLIAIVTSYLLLFSKGEISQQDPSIYGVVAVLLICLLVLYRLPIETFHRRFFDTFLMVFDTVLISMAIYMKRDVSWDLFLFYFFILFLAAIGADMLKIVLGSVVLNLVYLGLLIQQGKGLTQIGSDVLVRVSFLFGASILYGYLSENARKEKTRAEAAEQRERLKTDLVSGLAHDIKHPLGVIMGYTELLKDQLSGNHEEKTYLETLERVQESGQRIVNLVTGFLEASRADARKLEIAHRRVSVNNLLKELTRQQQADLQKKQLTLELNLDETLPDILGDKAQLDRVFWNLIGNAIKFTRAGGKITVSSSRDNAHICIAVKDTGIGIARDELSLLFSQFRRLKGAAKVEGTGLGLFIVKTIIEAHKGTVQVESVEDQGSTFTVRVPTSPWTRN